MLTLSLISCVLVYGSCVFCELSLFGICYFYCYLLMYLIMTSILHVLRPCVSCTWQIGHRWNSYIRKVQVEFVYNQFTFRFNTTFDDCSCSYQIALIFLGIGICWFYYIYIVLKNAACVWERETPFLSDHLVCVPLIHKEH